LSAGDQSARDGDGILLQTAAVAGLLMSGPAMAAIVKKLLIWALNNGPLRLQNAISGPLFHNGMTVMLQLNNKSSLFYNQVYLFWRFNGR